LNHIFSYLPAEQLVVGSPRHVMYGLPPTIKADIVEKVCCCPYGYEISFHHVNLKDVGFSHAPAKEFALALWLDRRVEITVLGASLEDFNTGQFLPIRENNPDFEDAQQTVSELTESLRASTYHKHLTAKQFIENEYAGALVALSHLLL
jgi:hypothetical protein